MPRKLFGGGYLCEHGVQMSRRLVPARLLSKIMPGELFWSRHVCQRGVLLRERVQWGGLLVRQMSRRLQQPRLMRRLHLRV